MRTLLLSVLVFFILGLFIATYLFARPHLWSLIWNAKVSYQGELAPESSVYRSGNDLLILVSTPEKKDSMYIFYSSSNLIGIPSGNQFIFLPMFAYSKEVVPPAVMSGNSIKIEIDMNIVVDENDIEFTTLEGGRAKVELPR